MGSCISKGDVRHHHEHFRSHDAGSSSNPPSTSSSAPSSPGGALANLQARSTRALAGYNSHRPRTAAIPPKPMMAELRWPDGRISSGKVLSTVEMDGKSEAKFYLKNTGIVSERFHNKGWKRRLAPSDPRPLVVEPSEGGLRFKPSLPDYPATEIDFDGLKYQALDTIAGVMDTFEVTVVPNDFRQIVKVAGGLDGELEIYQMRIVDKILGTSLESIASRCLDCDAALNAAQALSELPAVFRLSLSGTTQDIVDSKFIAGDNRLEDLKEGEHLLINIFQLEDNYGHSMMLSATRLAEDDVRLTLVNSNGWAESGINDRPAMSKTMSMDDAAGAIFELAEGRMPSRPLGTSESDWLHSGRGRPLVSWLDANGRYDSQRDESFHGLPLRSVPQKADDCGIEVKLAWLATVLPPSDYKLVKSAFLNVVKSTGQALLENRYSDRNDTELQAAIVRLETRITTSLSGSTVAP